MIFSRHTAAIVVAGSLFMECLRAQEQPASSSTGASSSFGSPASSGSASGGSSGTSATPGGSNASPGTAPGQGSGTPGGSNPSFRTNASGTAPSDYPAGFPDNSGASGGTSPFNPGGQRSGVLTPSAKPGPSSANTDTMTPPGAASSFGGPGGVKTESAPTTFTIPASYGRAPIQLRVGEGRLARPLYRITGSTAIGYDDNVLQTPTHGPSTADQVVRTQLTAASPAHTEVQQVQQSDGTFAPVTVDVPAVDATFKDTVVKGTPAAQRQGSLVNRGTVGWDVQFASRRTLFTFDLNAGADYYWSRPGKKTDYNGSLALAYLYKLTPRAQVTATVNTSYQSQPDLSQANTPTSNNVGNYLSFNSKADLTYRLMPRFSTVTSVSYNTLLFATNSQQSNNYSETVFGTELRYLFSPRLTLVGELRYGSISYASDPTRDSHTYFLLGGADFALSRRFSATLRIGEAVRTFVESGAQKSSPYLESSLSYLLGRATSLQWNARYGFEEPPDANTTVETLRTGGSLMHAFTPRLRGNLGLNLVRQTSTNDAANSRSAQTTAESTLGLDYTLSRRWSFRLDYTYTVLFSNVSTSEYYRNRLFLTGQFQF